MILFIMWVRWTLAPVSLRPAHGPGLEVADPAGAGNLVATAVIVQMICGLNEIVILGARRPELGA